MEVRRNLPLQNRVDPAGALVAVAARGLFTGNRGGRFHNPATRELGRARWASRQWICCLLDFRGRQRAVWGHGYTELFFCDEVTALAAGHRPCFECRRGDALAFAEAAAEGLGLSRRPSAPELDLRLDAERRSGSAKRMHRLRVDDLPDGAVIAADGGFFALRDGRACEWTHSGYRADVPRPRGAADVLTPPTALAALAAGYRPRWAAAPGA